MKAHLTLKSFTELSGELLSLETSLPVQPGQGQDLSLQPKVSGPAQSATPSVAESIKRVELRQSVAIAPGFGRHWGVSE